MSSRSATILVIFSVAIVAFCLASVFGAMTGTISILPNNSEDSGSILDNLSAITEGTGDTGNSYGHESYNDYSGSSQSSSSNDQVETTTDDSSSSQASSQTSGSGSSSSQSGSSSSQSSGSSNVVTTTDDTTY